MQVAFGSCPGRVRRSRSIHEPVRDPTSIHWPEMIDNQEKNTIFLKPLVTSPKIEVGESPTTTATTTRMIRLCYCGERRWLRRKRRRLDEVGGLRLQASGRVPAVARWRSPRAIGAFDEALTIVSRVSASWDVRRVRARLRRLGVRRRPARIDRPKTGWEALTEAESMVQVWPRTGAPVERSPRSSSSPACRRSRSILSSPCIRTKAAPLELFREISGLEPLVRQPARLGVQSDMFHAATSLTPAGTTPQAYSTVLLASVAVKKDDRL